MPLPVKTRDGRPKKQKARRSKSRESAKSPSLGRLSLDFDQVKLHQVSFLLLKFGNPFLEAAPVLAGYLLSAAQFRLHAICNGTLTTQAVQATRQRAHAQFVNQCHCKVPALVATGQNSRDICFLYPLVKLLGHGHLKMSISTVRRHLPTGISYNKSK